MRKIDQSEIIGASLISEEPPIEHRIMSRWRDGETCKVSIVCHTYNHEKFIEQALRGFLSQLTGFPFEIIIHDDASTDGTASIVERYQAAYPHIIRAVLQKENQYRLGLRPQCFTFPLARGDYIAFCEGDDYWTDRDKLAKQVAVMDRHPSVVMSYHDAIRVNEEGVVVGHSEPSKAGHSSEQLVIAPFIPSLTRVFRNKPFHWLDLRPLPVAMDMALTSYLSRYGDAVYVDDIAPAVYRVHNGGMWSRTGAAERLRTTLDALLFIARRYQEEGDDRSAQRLLTRVVSEVIASLGSVMVLNALMRSLSAKLKARLKRLLTRLKR